MNESEIKRIEGILTASDMSDADKAACIHGLHFTHVVTGLEAKLRGGHDCDLISDDALRTTMEFYDADNVIMANTDVELQVAGNYMREITREGVPPICGDDPVYLNKYPIFLQAIKEDAPVVMPDISLLFPPDSIEYKRLAMGGIHSFLAVPYHKRHSGLVAIVNPRRFQTEISMLQVLSYVSVAEINEKTLMQYIKENDLFHEEKDPNEVYVKFFDGLEIHSPNGILTENNFKSSRDITFLACVLMNGKTGYPGETLAEALWFNTTKPQNIRHSLINIAGESRDRMRQFFPDGDLVIWSNFRFSVSPQYKVRTDLQDIDDLFIEALRKTDTGKLIEICKKILNDYAGHVLPSQHNIPIIHEVDIKYQHLRLRVLHKCLELLASEKRYNEMLDIAFPEVFRFCSDPDLFYWEIKAYIGCNEYPHARSILNSHGSCLLPEQAEELHKLLGE